MTASTALKGHVFIDALVEAGLVPRYTQHVKIEAEVSGVTYMEWAGLAEENLLGVVPAIKPDSEVAA